MNFLVLAFFVPILSVVVGEPPFITGFGRCPGYDKYPYQYVKGRFPKVIKFPGTFTLDYHSKSTQDLPDDLVMKFKLKKFNPFTYDVPCFGGLGSCEYDVCVEKYFSEKLCSQFPPSQPCKCPIKAGELQIEGLEYQIPDPGFYGYFMTGNYEGRAVLYGKSNPEVEYGCVAFAFTIEAKQLEPWALYSILSLASVLVLGLLYSIFKRCCKRKATVAKSPKKKE